jgi:NPCBM/NEW2 domain
MSNRISRSMMPALACLCLAAHAADEPVLLRGENGVAITFERTATGYLWTGYDDAAAGARWTIGGPRFSVQTLDDTRTNLGHTGFESLVEEDARVVLETTLVTPPILVRQTFSFCADGRTVRIQSAVRAKDEPVTIKQVGLLEIAVEGETPRLTGPGTVSCPIFGKRIFAGVEHPSAFCQVDGSTLYLAQHPYTEAGPEWVDLSAAVFGTASAEDVSLCGENEAVRRAFLRYMDTVRVTPADMHVHYNDWWTAPVPSSQEFVARNIATLKRDLFDATGFFFDSYAMDLGWSDSHSVWEIDTKNFPNGFNPVRDALAEVGSRPGLWVSPSSMYPSALDNAWLESADYEVTQHERRFACLTVGGKYQTAFKNAVLKHARAANLAHIKFDGFMPECGVDGHGHPPGQESRLFIAQGLMDVFDAVRAHDPNIALEPTCFGYQPSPWWLMHTPFIIGPFGDDSPDGRCPCPDWVESMTTARDIENLKGRDAFLLPSSALQCFDIIVQCPGSFQNHAAMAIGRGRWFISSYINPKFMAHDEWRFYAGLMVWARHNRDFLQEPLPVGGDPAQREAYGYAFHGEGRQIVCLRNPWVEEVSFAFPERAATASFAPTTEIRTLYPRREILARVEKGSPLPDVRLGPYETAFVELVPTEHSPGDVDATPRLPGVSWRATQEPLIDRTVFNDEPAAFGPSWSCPDGDAKEMLAFHTAGELDVTGAASAELCVLCEGEPDVALSTCAVLVDGEEVLTSVSTSVGAFYAAQQAGDEDWVWFMAPVPEGRHDISVRVDLKAVSTADIAVFLRGTVRASAQVPPFDPGPSFPQYNPDQKTWSRTLVPAFKCTGDTAPVETRARQIVTIDGVYLDTLEWTTASAGWGQVQRNRSIMEKPMTMAGRRYLRGIGTHANSRIVYSVPGDCATFAATIGYDQEVRNGSIVFVVEGGGKELFRSTVFGFDTPPEDIRVPLGGVPEITLVVEDAGDGVGADHGNWADARFLR